MPSVFEVFVMAMLDRQNSTSLHPLQLDEFLPAPDRWTQLGVLLLFGLFLGAMGAAAVVDYNVTVQAVASIRPLQDLSIVQAATSGTVQQVLVQENQPIQQGGVIAELDGLERSRLRSLQTRRDRLQKFLQQYETQVNEVAENLKALEREILAKTKSFPTGEPVSNQVLPSNGAIETGLERLKQTALVESQGLTARRDRLLQQRMGLTNQIELDRAALQQLNKAINQQVIQSPIDGIVLKLSLRHSGQTVQQGETLAQIVPNTVPLVVKARVAVQDISQVEIGQLAQIRVSAYPYSDYGLLNGTVQAIAPDVIPPMNGSSSANSYYEVTIQPERSYFAKGDRRYPLQPGMEARADIISRSETVLQAFWRKLR
jgi:HlyD family secretion protein